MNTPQPVLKTEAVKAAVFQLLGAAAILTAHFDWWSPSGDDILVIGGAVASVLSYVMLGVAWLVHNRVRPWSPVPLPPPAAPVLGQRGAARGRLRT